MINISGNDISELNDVDLRSLIGLLCEADLHAAGLSTIGVTWGGNQDAKDGGIDVRVELSAILNHESYIPRSKTCYQVKRPDILHNKIINEMRPNGILRPVIKDLIDARGAYIIVSGQASTTDSALKERKNAMFKAVSDYQNASELKIDFYDRERIAAWVRTHPSLILWVRDRIGRPIQGWRTYGNWAKCPGDIKEEYILDDHIRLYNSTNHQSEGLSAIDGINQIRNILQQPGSCVRLVGLSGVGKTRLVQSLFDERIGKNPLNPSQVFYADMSDSPNPDPRNFTEQIISLQRPAILAIDNCPPELHNRLTSVCSTSSLVNLITIEYDVRDDQPEETEVFRLEAASDELIEKVICTRFSHITHVNARTIAKFSGGNSRIAIVLANTIQRGEDLSQLRDEELFRRLFLQRNMPNNNLLKAAEACSLVYSFDGQTIEGATSELKLLGSLVGMDVREIYENISELKRRELVQQRNKWRAILPHAIANRLAQKALEDIPLNFIYDVFENHGSERLLKSFSKRLGYLHESESAKEVSKRWLAKDGLLGDITQLNELGIRLFENIAPVNPELTLSVIEQVTKEENAQEFFSRENAHYSEFTRLLRAIAYGEELFERSVELLCRFTLSEKIYENINSISDLLESLFYVFYSGTHATPIQRLNIISNLIESNSEAQNTLGISLLGASLESWHFRPYYDFEFGARIRDNGFSPKNKEEYHQWFRLFIDYTVSLVVNDHPVSTKIKSVFAEKFRGLWIKADMYKELEEAAIKISNKNTWREGWIAVKTTKKFDGKTMNPKKLSILNELDKILKPTTLIERAKLYAFSRHGGLDLIDTIKAQNEKANDSYIQIVSLTRSLGRDVGSNDKIFKELLSDILSNDGAQLFAFGQGLADGCVNPKKMWHDFREQLSITEESKRNFQVLQGFLNSIFEVNPDLSEILLDEAVTDDVLSIVFPLLQTSITIKTQGVKRLKKSLELGKTPIWQYNYLAYGRAHETISDDDLSELLKMITSKPKGILVAVEIMRMRLFGHSKDKILSKITVSTGQELLLQYRFSKKDNSGYQMDYKLAEIIKVCFTNKSAQENAKVLCDKLVQAFTNYDIYSMDYNNTIEALATVQPIVFLNSFLRDDVDSIYDRISHVLLTDNELTSNPISHIDDDLLINWCEENPNIRYPKAATAIVPFQINIKSNSIEWTPLAMKLIANFSDPIVILNKFIPAFRPMSWSGSRADVMQSRLCLFSDLIKHENSLISDWARKEERRFKEEIRSEREWELKHESERNESFE